MNILYYILLFLACGISSYLIGSISSAVLITKYIYHIDIYKVGSGNAGGTNVGRAAGKKAAYATIICDVLKTIIATWGWFFIIEATPLKDFVLTVSPSIHTSLFYYFAGICVAIGHHYPIFEHFKGGKCVACYGGFCIATNYILTIIGVSIFLMVLLIKKRVSLASLIGVSSVLICSIALAICFNFYPNISSIFYFNSSLRIDASYYQTIAIAIYTFLVVIFHKANIKRLANNTEPETHFKKESN